MSLLLLFRQTGGAVRRAVHVPELLTKKKARKRRASWQIGEILKELETKQPPQLPTPEAPPPVVVARQALKTFEAEPGYSETIADLTRALEEVKALVAIDRQRRQLMAAIAELKRIKAEQDQEDEEIMILLLAA